MASVVAAGPDVLAFREARLRDEPFPHFVAPAFYTDAFAATLLAWLERTTAWQLKETLLFEQYQLGFADFRDEASIAGLWHGAVLARLRDAVAATFGVALSDRINISAHKLVPGQFGSIHTDNVPEESHRLVVQLNRGRPAGSGGHLVFLSGPKPADLHTTFRQASNSAIGFRLGADSHHAITPVHSGTRFTVIYTFLAPQATGAGYRYFTAG